MQEAKITAAEDQLFCVEFAVSCAKYQIFKFQIELLLKSFAVLRQHGFEDGTRGIIASLHPCTSGRRSRFDGRDGVAHFSGSSPSAACCCRLACCTGDGAWRLQSAAIASRTATICRRTSSCPPILVSAVPAATNRHI